MATRNDTLFVVASSFAAWQSISSTHHQAARNPNILSYSSPHRVKPTNGKNVGTPMLITKKILYSAIILFLAFCSAIIIAQPQRSYNMPPAAAKMIIEKRANALMLAAKKHDWQTFTKYIHPTKNLRITYHTYITHKDPIFRPKQIANGMNDKTIFHFGYHDGSGEPIRLTLPEYFKVFYQQDYLKAPQISYNRVLHHSNMIENSQKYYPDAIMVSYYFPEIDPNMGGFDWTGRRLFFESYLGKWYLVGIIHDSWAI